VQNCLNNQTKSASSERISKIEVCGIKLIYQHSDNDKIYKTIAFEVFTYLSNKVKLVLKLI
jgi:hypothetical protein